MLDVVDTVELRLMLVRGEGVEVEELHNVVEELRVEVAVEDEDEVVVELRV